jgi:Na+/H+-dicarboxylate symporter
LGSSRFPRRGGDAGRIGQRQVALVAERLGRRRFHAKAHDQSTVAFLMAIIPDTVTGAFANGEILQVLFFALLFAFGLQMLGERGKPVLKFLDDISKVSSSRSSASS